MAVAFSAETHHDAFTTTTTTFDVSISVGDTVVVHVGCGSGLGVSTVSDNGTSGGNTYTSARNNGSVLVTYTCLNATKSATQMTVTSGNQPLNISVLRYTGVTSIGNTNAATASSTTHSVSVTIQEANNYVCGGFTTNGTPGTQTAQNGTFRHTVYNYNQASIKNSAMDNTSASVGSVTTSFTSANSVTWWANGVELRGDSIAAKPVFLFRSQVIGLPGGF